MLKLNFYCHLFVLVIICVFATIYVSTVQSAEPIEGSSSNNPQTTEGFLGLRTIVIPEEGLEAGEKEFLNAVKKVVDVLSKGKNVRQILNECDQYVAPFFGTKSGVVNQSSIGFSSLSVLEFDGLSEEKNPEEFYKKRTDTITLSSDLGYIVVSRYRNSFFFDWPPGLIDHSDHWRGNEVSSIRTFNCNTQTGVLLFFRYDGTLKSFSYVKYDCEVEEFTEKITTQTIIPQDFFRFFYVKSGVDRFRTWDSEGRLTEDQIIETPKFYKLDL